jgi:Na+-driven multidrug efflux pump
MAFALFASYQGAAETATWILLGYVWAVVETIPECFASAATVRVEHLLTNGHLSAAKEIARRAIALSTITSILFSIILLDTRRYLAWSLCLDETLEMMILEIIPYIALCQPLITAGVAANSLNEVLGKYSLSVGLSSVVDLCFTIPMGAIFTYSMNFNIESLASAQCMGYAATGMINLIIFSYTNWEYARSKILQYIEE